MLNFFEPKWCKDKPNYQFQLLQTQQEKQYRHSTKWIFYLFVYKWIRNKLTVLAVVLILAQIFPLNSKKEILKQKNCWIEIGKCAICGPNNSQIFTYEMKWINRLKINRPKERKFKDLQNLKTILHHQCRTSHGVIWILKVVCWKSMTRDLHLNVNVRSKLLLLQITFSSRDKGFEKTTRDFQRNPNSCE